MATKPPRKPTALAHWMTAAGVKGKDLARRLKVHPSMISRARWGGSVSDDVKTRIKEATGLKRL